jgi:L-ascorbate metabolism protein UlaG (beta-lactamase superfamily)
MHYKTPAVSIDLAPVDAFLTGKTVRIVSGNQFSLNNTTLPVSTTVFLPGYSPAAPVTTAVTATVTSSVTAPITSTLPMTLTWLGQSMFTLNVPGGPNIMIDPVGASVGYKVTPMDGIDAVTVSHEHADHNNVALATGSPKILRGLANNDWAKVDETVKGVRIRDVNTFHDDTQGSARGKNAVFVYEANGMRIVHLGDLGHQLSADQVKEIGPVDVLIIPVGGFYTIDAAGATLVVDALKPKVVIPMHYKTPAVSLPIAPVDNFLLGKTYQVVAGNQILLSAATLPKTTTVFIPGYEASRPLPLSGN